MKQPKNKREATSTGLRDVTNTEKEQIVIPAQPIRRKFTYKDLFNRLPLVTAGALERIQWVSLSQFQFSNSVLNSFFVSFRQRKRNYFNMKRKMKKSQHLKMLYINHI